MLYPDNEWQGKELGLGVLARGSLEYAFTPRIGVELAFLGGGFFKASNPEQPEYAPTNGAGFGALGIGVRAHPFDDLRGLWVGASLMGAYTNGVVRPGFDARIGFDLHIATFYEFGPFVGYAHVFADPNGLRPGDAMMLLFGLHFAFDEGRTPPPPPPEIVHHHNVQPPDSVRCENGCLDVTPSQALRVLDACPDDPEDYVGSSDADGCYKEAEVKVVANEIQLNDRVYFDFRQATIRRESSSLLASLAALINAHPEFELIYVDGHTDETGTDEYNQILSEARAAAVRTELISHGVQAWKLRSRGFGKSQPRVLGHSEDERQGNRRVEFIIGKKRVQR
jgi:outer membrane protein OmpA-like peptidoglycan-associated protein